MEEKIQGLKNKFTFLGLYFLKKNYISPAKSLLTNMKIIYLLFLLLGAVSVNAQRNAYQEVDDYVKSLKVPVVNAKNMESVAHLVADKWDADSLKA